MLLLIVSYPFWMGWTYRDVSYSKLLESPEPLSYKSYLYLLWPIANCLSRLVVNSFHKCMSTKTIVGSISISFWTHIFIQCVTVRILRESALYIRNQKGNIVSILHSQVAAPLNKLVQYILDVVKRCRYGTKMFLPSISLLFFQLQSVPSLHFASLIGSIAIHLLSCEYIYM